MQRLSPTSVLIAGSVAVAAVDPERLGSLAGFQPAALAILSFAAAILSLRQHGVPSPSPSLALLAGWLGWSVIGAALSHQPGSAFLSIASFAAVGIAVANLAIRAAASDIAFVAGLAGIVSIALALAVSLSGGDGGLSGRFQLLFLEPNQLARAAGLVLVSIATVGVHRVLAERNFSGVPIIALATGAAFVVLVITESRTGVAAAAVGVLLVVTSQLSRQLSVAALAAVGLLLGAGAIAVLTGSAGESINQSLSRSTSAPTDELRTLNGRTVLWPEVVSLAMERPVTGAGLGLDRDLVSRFRAEGRVVWTAEHTHSLPLQLWLTTGIPGLLLVGAAMGLSARTAWRRTNSAERTLVLGLLAVIVVDGIVEPAVRVPSFAWFALVVATCLTAGDGSSSTEREPS